jgi:hypothetical protein
MVVTMSSFRAVFEQKKTQNLPGRKIVPFRKTNRTSTAGYETSGWLAGWLPAWLAGWLADRLSGCLLGWLAGWLAGWLVG